MNNRTEAESFRRLRNWATSRFFIGRMAVTNLRNLKQMLGSYKNILKQSRLFAFNPVDRDAWVREQATLVPAGSLVLDVGAGSCPYRSLFSHCSYATQDVARLKDYQLRNGSYGAIDYLCDAAAIPVPASSFDVILCTEVLEHHSEPIKVVQEFSRVLKPGGRIILSAPLGSGIHQEPYHFYGGFTPYWYQKFLSEHGFIDITIKENAGFFRFYSQESIRFVTNSRSFALGMPMLKEILWLPFWLLFFAFLGLAIPIFCACLDRYDTEKRFTVGYHVIAKKKRNAP